MAGLIRASVGLNFGSQLLSGGFRNWPVDQPVPLSMRQAASEVFAFDALIQNPDRRYNNPNLLSRDDQIFVIDHDLAFSFLYALGTQSAPWVLDGLAFLDHHVFFRQLKGTQVKFERFVGALEALSDKKISQIAGLIPQEWETEHLVRVIEHLRLLRDHAAEFGQQVQRRLV